MDARALKRNVESNTHVVTVCVCVPCGPSSGPLVSTTVIAVAGGHPDLGLGGLVLRELGGRRADANFYLYLHSGKE